MANKDNFCLRLKEFGSNIKESWQQLQIDKDFCDVTLACNDGQIQSHRIILTHSSPVLKDILKQNSNSNPFVYLRGVTYKSLESLIHFMYQGEVTVSDEDLINFLEVAEDLKVTGLSPEDSDSVTPSYDLPEDEGLSNNQNEELHSNSYIHDEKAKQDSRESSFQGKHKRPKSTKLTRDDSTVIDNFRKNNLKDSTEEDNSNRESHSESNHENVEQNTTNSEYGRERRSESKHEDIGPYSMKKRIENHSVGLLTKFENFFNNADSSFLHQEPKTIRLDMAEDLKVPRLLPENVEAVTPSDELQENMDEVLAISQNEDLHSNSNIHDDKAKQDSKEYPFQRKEIRPKSTKLKSDDSIVIDNFRKSNLNYLKEEDNKDISDLRHRKNNTKKLVSVSDRQFSCDKCDKHYTTPKNLKKHKASSHEGVRYPCDECNAGPFTQADNLRTHKASVHEGVRYPCDECNAGPFTQSSNLRTHKASAHEGVRYPCDECNAGPFTGKDYLRKHKASAHEGVRYPCDECNAGPFTMKDYLRKHKASAHKGGGYPCDECNSGPFTGSAYLRKHKASAHVGVRYECNICDYKATTKGNLKKHCIIIHKF